MSTVITAGNATNGLSLSADNAGAFEFKTGTGAGTTAMTINSSQNVGIGTTTVGAKLHVSQVNTTVGALFNGTTRAIRFGFDTTGSVIEGVDNTGVTSFQPLLVGGSDVRFTTSGTERMRLDSNGRLYINTTAAVGALPAYETIVGNANSISLITLQDTGTTYGSGTQYITFANSSATVAGSVQHNAAGTVNFATSSDFRLKENIVDSSNALTVVDAIKVRAFDWKEDNGHVDFGFIAQELQQHYPDAVCAGDNDAELTDPKGTWQVDYGKLTPLLLKAIQELSAKVAALEAR